MELSIHPGRRHALSPYLFMQFMEPVGTADSSVDAGWDYLHECWHSGLMEQVRRLEPPMVRFGGCFASYYHWREAVGPRDSRIPVYNACWDGVFSNQVGTDEVMDFCRQAKAEPLLVVNMESDGVSKWAHPRPDMDRLGTPEEAAAWVRYCNDPGDTLRAANGHCAPYGVKYWQLGNETSYDNGPFGFGFSCEAALDATNRFAEAMLKADPSLKLIAWGDSGWAERFAKETGDEIPYLAFHHHFGPGGKDSPLYGMNYRKDPDATWAALLAAPDSLETHIAEMRRFAEPYGKRLAMTEGHFALPGRNRSEVMSSWAVGAAYAKCFHILQRNGDIVDIATEADFFGNCWQNNCIMVPSPAWSGKPYLQPVGHVMRLYRHHIGRFAADVTANGHVDAAASISADGKTLFLHLLNLDRTSAQVINLRIGERPTSAWKAFTIAADSTAELTGLEPADAFEPVMTEGTGCRYTLPAAGVAALEIPVPASGV